MHVVWNIINELHEILFMVLKPLNLQSYKIEKPPKNEEWRMLFSEQHSNDNIVRKCVRWATETHWPWKHHLPLSERQRLLPAWPWCCCWNITCWYAGMRNTVKWLMPWWLWILCSDSLAPFSVPKHSRIPNFCQNNKNACQDFSVRYNKVTPIHKHVVVSWEPI